MHDADSDGELRYAFNNLQEKYVYGMGKGKEVSLAKCCMVSLQKGASSL